jgi:hypothetical protein
MTDDTTSATSAERTDEQYERTLRLIYGRADCANTSAGWAVREIDRLRAENERQAKLIDSCSTATLAREKERSKMLEAINILRAASEGYGKMNDERLQALGEIDLLKSEVAALRKTIARIAVHARSIIVEVSDGV